METLLVVAAAATFVFAFNEKPKPDFGCAGRVDVGFAAGWEAFSCFESSSSARDSLAGREVLSSASAVLAWVSAG